jgi:hypothetical protein
MDPLFVTICLSDISAYLGTTGTSDHHRHHLWDGDGDDGIARLRAPQRVTRCTVPLLLAAGCYPTLTTRRPQLATCCSAVKDQVIKFMLSCRSLKIIHVRSHNQPRYGRIVVQLGRCLAGLPYAGLT